MQIYCDMDGVLADFDTGYERAFGVRPSKQADDVDWKLVESVPNFYRDLPLMPDALDLWEFFLVSGHKPIILTGVPSSIPEAPANKKAWAPAKLPYGYQVEVRCCPSKEKFKSCQPGDVLIDDWIKYKPLWEGAGGVWITHTSAAESIAALKGLGL